MMEQTFTKKFKKTIDLTGIELPPTWAVTKQNDIKHSSESQNGFFLSGPKRLLANYLIDLIDNAQNSVVLSSFLLADKALEDVIYQASFRGVRVYIMLACETRLEGDTPDDDFGKMCLEQHLKMLKRLGGHVMFRTASHFHSKVVLVDALKDDDESNPKGVLLTANLTTEALERNEELAVVLTTPEIIELTRLLKWAMFEYAEHELLDTKDFSAIKPLNTVEFPKELKAILNTSSMSNSIQDSALKIINNATSELVVSSFGWQEDHKVIDAICAKARKGVRVIILARIRPSSMASLLKLANAGAQVFGYKWLHAKAIWNDKNESMMMSANLQKYGLDQGFEIGLVIQGKRAEQLKSCLDSLYVNTAKTVKLLKLKSTLIDHLGEIECWENNTLRKVKIDQHNCSSLGEITADCVTSLDKEAAIPKSTWKTNPVHHMEYVWTVKPPALPSNAKEIFWEEKVEVKHKGAAVTSKKASPKDKIATKPKPKFKTINRSYEPKVYSHKGRVMIAIKQSNDLPKAIILRDRDFSNATVVLSNQG